MASKSQLFFAMICLLMTLLFILIQYLRYIRIVNREFSTKSEPFNYYFAIYNGILLIVLNEIIILAAIILTNQTYTIFGREKALLQIFGYGLYMYGWTNIALFNVSIKSSIRRIVRFLFIGVMVFYIFAMATTTLIIFNLTFGYIPTDFIGIGYEAAVAIYILLLFGDLIALGITAIQKRRLSKYQAWLGFLLFSSLFLQIISIFSNAIPVLIAGRVSSSTHAVWNFVVEPLTYLLTAPLTLLILSWTLFNPQWLKDRMIEEGS